MLDGIQHLLHIYQSLVGSYCYSLPMVLFFLPFPVDACYFLFTHIDQTMHIQKIFLNPFIINTSKLTLRIPFRWLFRVHWWENYVYSNIYSHSLCRDFRGSIYHRNMATTESESRHIHTYTQVLSLFPYHFSFINVVLRKYNVQ